MTKRFLTTTALVAAVIMSAPLTGPASAADMRAPAMKAPIMMQPAFSWTGFYAGFDTGWMRSQQDVTWFPGGAGRVFEHDKSSWIWSAHVGAQMQFGVWVLGVEGSGIFRSSALRVGSPPDGCPNAGFTCQASLDRLWTVGPRLGVAVANTWMPYVTGGYASGRVRTRSFATATGIVFDDLSKDDDGWFIGVGLEHGIPLNPNVALVLGIEYKHIDLGSTRLLSFSGVVDGNTRDISSTADVIAARVSLKFN